MLKELPVMADASGPSRKAPRGRDLLAERLRHSSGRPTLGLLPNDDIDRMSDADIRESLDLLDSELQRLTETPGADSNSRFYKRRLTQLAVNKRKLVEALEGKLRGSAAQI